MLINTIHSGHVECKYMKLIEADIPKIWICKDEKSEDLKTQNGEDPGVSNEFPNVHEALLHSQSENPQFFLHLCTNGTFSYLFEIEGPSPSSVLFHKSPGATLGRASCSSASAGPHRRLALAPSYTDDAITFFEMASCRRIRCWRRANPTRGSIGVAKASRGLCRSIDRGDRGGPRRAGILDFAGDVPSSRRLGRPAGGRPGGGSVCHDEDRPGGSRQWVFLRPSSRFH